MNTLRYYFERLKRPAAVAVAGSLALAMAGDTTRVSSSAAKEMATIAGMPDCSQLWALPKWAIDPKTDTPARVVINLGIPLTYRPYNELASKFSADDQNDVVFLNIFPQQVQDFVDGVPLGPAQVGSIAEFDLTHEAQVLVASRQTAGGPMACKLAFSPLTS
jgi:hypothetical protein